MRRILAVILTAGAVLPGLALASGQGRDLFSCDFNQPAAKEWKFVGGQWAVQDGCLKSDRGPGDPNKALLILGPAEAVSADVLLTARIRIDSWREGDWARAGIGLCADAASGRGLNLLFHKGRLNLMRDFIAWGPSCDFEVHPGRWYRMKLLKTSQGLSGKAWLEGESEPADWQVTWDEIDPGVKGYPALVGGSGGAGSDVARVSFGRCELRRVLPSDPVAWRATRQEASLRSLRLAVEDLVRTFAGRYARGREYLARIEELEKAFVAARPAAGQAGDSGRLDALAAAVEALRAEALLANPLLDFDKLLLVKRRDARTMKVRPQVRGEAASFYGNDAIGFLNGLPINFQGNSYLRELPFDNEIAVLSPVRPGGRLTRLYRPERDVYVGNLNLHFDADRLMFSSVGSHDRWQVFEIGADGRGLRQVTPGLENDVDNYDSCYLPDGRVLFASSACFQSVPCERRLDEVANFCVMNADGTGVRRLCFDQDHNFCPTLLADGRVLYTRWEYTDIAHAFSARLMTMNPDGMLQRAHYASSSHWPNRIFYARAIPRRPNMFVGIVTGHHGTARAGELVLFDVALGRTQADGVVQQIPGWGRKVRPKMVDNLVDRSWPKFLHPHPLSDKYFLVSCQPAAGSRWGIYLVDVFDNSVLLCEEDGCVLFEPVPLRSTPRPPVIPDRVNLASRKASVYLSDIYAGEGLCGVPRGTVTKLRLFTYHFNFFGTSGIEDYIGMDGPWDVRRVLGTVPVAEDGSAWFEVPANMPIAVQPLDAEGKALQLMRSWFTAMPGEAVSCVGCHESVNSGPPSRPTVALAGGPSQIQPWRGPARGFSWDREVQPVLDKYCVGCHNGWAASSGGAEPDLRQAAARSLPLSPAPFPPSFYALRRFVRSPGLEGDPQLLPVADYHADANPLVQMLRKGHRGVQLDEEAWDRIVTWLDMNAPAYGTWMEVPTVSGNPKVRACRDRRMDLVRRYGGIEEDYEAIPDTPRPAVTPVTPPPLPAGPVPTAADWPFPADQAGRRQAAAGERTAMSVELAPGVKMDLVLIPAGEMVMGEASSAYADERPACRAKIERAFWMGATEVTNEQYALFDAEHSSGVEPKLWLKWSRDDFFKLDRPGQPVCRVSWQEARAFCDWLSAKTGKRFSLPSEAQWEWACRAGSAERWSFPDSPAASASFANLADSAMLDLGRLARLEKVRPFMAVDPVDDKSTVSAPVGSYQPNRWGLFDMHGNVAEWTSSAYVPYPFSPGDPRHAAAGGRRSVRGGSWYERADLARSACRTGYWPWQRVFNVGFRVVCQDAK